MCDSVPSLVGGCCFSILETMVDEIEKIDYTASCSPLSSSVPVQPGTVRNPSQK